MEREATFFFLLISTQIYSSQEQRGSGCIKNFYLLLELDLCLLARCLTMLIEMQSFMLRFYRSHRAKVPSDGLSGERVFILGSDIQGWTWVSSSSNTEGWTLRPQVVKATSLSPFPRPSVSELKWWNKIIYIYIKKYISSHSYCALTTKDLQAEAVVVVAGLSLAARCQWAGRCKQGCRHPVCLWRSSSAKPTVFPISSII